MNPPAGQLVQMAGQLEPRGKSPTLSAWRYAQQKQTDAIKAATSRLLQKTRFIAIKSDASIRLRQIFSLLLPDSWNSVYYPEQPEPPGNCN